MKTKGLQNRLLFILLTRNLVHEASVDISKPFSLFVTKMLLKPKEVQGESKYNETNIFQITLDKIYLDFILIVSYRFSNIPEKARSYQTPIVVI